MTMLEILDETANFYNSGNRSVDGGSCRYNSQDGMQCAFGRCVRDEEVGLLTEDMAVQPYFLSLLKPEYQGHELMFWRDIQQLHDHGDNWDIDGLTEVGKRRYTIIKNDMNKGYCPFSK